jgi:hypothetical protein
MGIARLVVGALALLVGRKLYWFSVAVVGFMAGLTLGARLLAGQPQWLWLLVAVVLGLLGALLAAVAQRVAIALGGCLAGGVVALYLSGLSGLGSSRLALLIFGLGGALGLLLILVVFDWALIALSSLGGASLIVAALSPMRAPWPLIFLGLVVVGVAVQAATLYAERRHAPESG